jgi:hypothetical protein
MLVQITKSLYDGNLCVSGKEKFLVELDKEKKFGSPFQAVSTEQVNRLVLDDHFDIILYT